MASISGYSITLKLGLFIPAAPVPQIISDNVLKSKHILVQKVTQLVDIKWHKASPNLQVYQPSSNVDVFRVICHSVLLNCNI